MKRRIILRFAALTLALPVWVLAQTARRFRVGWLQSVTPAEARVRVEAFVAGMRERGYVRDEHYLLDIRYGENDARRFPALADELLALKPDVLLGVETNSRVMVAKTSSIPIVLTTSIDPVAAGLVKSLARPGTNVTGFVDLYDQLIAKHVELLLEIVPKASRFALLNDPLWSAHESYEQHARAAAASRNLDMTVVPLTDAKALQQSFAILQKKRVNGLVIGVGGKTNSLRNEIIEGARWLRVPTISGRAYFAWNGGLVSYGPNPVENSRQAAEFVDRIIKGAKAADMPVRQTTTFELVVNQKAAHEIGITIPKSILLRADRVIE